MPPALFLKPFISAPLHGYDSVPIKRASSVNIYVENGGRVGGIRMGMLAPRNFMQKRKKVEVFNDEADEAYQKNWRRLMNEIEEAGTAVAVLRRERVKNQALPRELVLGTLKRFKQMKRWNLVSEIIEWLRIQSWWNISEMDLLMLITAYGKQGDFNSAERVMSYMNKKNYPPSVISHTALMEAYGRGKRYKNAEAIFRRMQSSGPEPSALTYQIILKTFVESNQFKEAEEVFETLLDSEKSPLKPDQKMFHMMIYMHKKAGSYEKARRVFSLMAERGVEQSTVTYNSLMSFETNYKEVSRIYDQMQRADLQPDVVSYALLVNAYGKARREEEALVVFENMLSAGVRPTQKAYNILLDAFAISGMVEQARTVFKSMRRDRCTPDLCSYTTMLSAYVNALDMDGAEKFFRRLKQDGLSPNEVTYGALIKGYAKENELEKMMKKYEEMRSSGIRANQTVLTTIMDAYGKNKDFDSAVIWFKEMESSGVSPDKKAKNILLSLAKSNEELLEANVLVGNMDDQDGVPESNAKVTFTHNKDTDEDDDDDYDDDDADDKEEEDDDDDSDDAEEAISIGVERDDAVALGSADMSYVL